MTKFPPHKLATKYLSGLKGVEVGGSAHNSFQLNTINVDYTAEYTVYKEEELRMCGEMLKVDVVADAASLPFEPKSFDFVISSHMLEHAFDPITVVQEWARVAKKYIFIIIPRKEFTFDKDKPVTPVWELIDRWDGKIKKAESAPADDHWSIWDVVTFQQFCAFLCGFLHLRIIEFEEKDTKVGNGMMVLFEVL